MQTLQYNYINTPVRLFVEQLDAFLTETWPGTICTLDLKAALAELQEQACEEPSIVPWIRMSIQQGHGILPEQLMLISLATFSRSSSTYASIPEIVTVLAAAGDYDLAAMINDNAVHEAGTSRIQSHPKMLLAGIEMLFKSLVPQGLGNRLHALSPSLIAALRLYMQLTDSERAKVINAPECLRCFAAQRKEWLPEANSCDLEALVHYASFIPEGLFDYHHAIIRDVLGMSPESSDANPRLSPSSQRWLAIQAIEFSFREASSADELPHKLSYVGAFGSLCRHYLGYVNEVTNKHVVMCWWVAHSDEEIGKALGWNDTAELGHARDARILVERVLQGITQEDLTVAIRSAARMSRLRNRHWKIVTDRLSELDEQQPANLRIPFKDESYDSSNCFKQVGLHH